MKKLLLFLALSFTSLTLFADDTSALQTLITAGNTTLPGGHNYNISSPGLNLTHNLTVPAGDTITYTSGSGYAMTMNTANKKLICLGLLQGTSDTTNSSGTGGVVITADFDTVMNSNIRKFTNDGIVGVTVNNPEIYRNRVTNIGYVGIFLGTTGANKTGGKVEYNYIDRSSLSAHKISEAALLIRCTDSTHTYTDWLVQYNTIVMPVSPDSINAECFELRFCPFSVINNNTCRGGSIGISVVRSDWVSTKVNFCSNQNLEGIEYADSKRGFIYTNSVTNQLHLGILEDGVSGHGCAYTTFYGNQVSGCQSYCLQLSGNVTVTTSSGDKFNTRGTAIDIQGASGLSLANPTFTGNGAATYAILLDTSTGDVRILGGLVSGFTGHAFEFFSATATVTDDIVMNGVTLQNTPAGYTSNLSGGATLGSNIRLN